MIPIFFVNREVRREREELKTMLEHYAKVLLNKNDIKRENKINNTHTCDPEIILLEFWVSSKERNQGCKVVNRLCGVIMDALCCSFAVRKANTSWCLEEKTVGLVIP